MEKRFTSLLLKWHKQENTREMPWKGEKDPYKIWLSEVILQQTRVEQGMGYYNRFVQKYPSIQKLAKAPDQEVFKLWEGLGYYTRCRNLLFTARHVVNENKGKFPTDHDSLLQLKGVGPYTAAAIASFAYDLPYAVVDGNVFRVLSRFFGIEEPIDSTAGKKLFAELAADMLSRKEPGYYNQAIMDFGAVVCKPVAPVCSVCPLQSCCSAFNEGKVNLLPVKEKTLQRKHRWFYYFIFECDGKFLVHERVHKDIWQHLNEFYLLESEAVMQWDETTVRSWLKQQLVISRTGNIHVSAVNTQQLTHQQIKGQFIRVQLEKLPRSLRTYNWQTISQLAKLPFPRFITRYLEVHPLQRGGR
jgi:A/G-specific adenine glycosylase